MRKKLYLLAVMFFGMIVITGCEVPWEKQAPPQVEEVVVVDKESIFENYIQTHMQNTQIERDDMKKILMTFEEENIFDDMIGPKGLQGRTYEEKASEAGDFAQKVMRDSGRMRLSQSNSTLTDEEIPVVDIVTAAKKYFHENDGLERYEKYLAQRFNVGIYPTPEELTGEWEGKITLTNVAILKEMAGAPIYDPKDLTAKNGREENINFTITMGEEESAKIRTTLTADDVIDPNQKAMEEAMAASEKKNPINEGKEELKKIQNLHKKPGIITPLAQKDGQTLPFYYDFIPKRGANIEFIQFTYSDIKEDGKMLGSFKGKDIQGSIDANLIKGENGENLLEGEIYTSLFRGYLKSTGKFTATQK